MSVQSRVQRVETRFVDVSTSGFKFVQRALVGNRKDFAEVCFAQRVVSADSREVVVLEKPEGVVLKRVLPALIVRTIV